MEPSSSLSTSRSSNGTPARAHLASLEEGELRRTVSEQPAPVTTHPNKDGQHTRSRSARFLFTPTTTTHPPHTTTTTTTTTPQAPPTRGRRRTLSQRELSKVNFGDVMRTLKEYGGAIDLEDSSPRVSEVASEGSGKSSFRTYHHEKKRCSRTGRVTQDAETQTHFPTGSTRGIEEVPLGAIYATVTLSWNALIMLFAEVIIEVLVVVELYPKIPFRLSFLFLTVLSGLLGFHTLTAVNRKEFDTSQNALQVSLLVELALIIGDVVFVVENHKKYPASLPTRAPFMVLTLLNVFLVIYLYVRLGLYERRTGHTLPECAVPVDFGLGTFEEVRRSLVPPITEVRQNAWTLDDLGVAVVRHFETQGALARRRDDSIRDLEQQQLLQREQEKDGPGDSNNEASDAAKTTTVASKQMRPHPGGGGGPGGVTLHHSLSALKEVDSIDENDGLVSVASSGADVKYEG